MKNVIIAFLFALITLLNSCSEKHLIKDNDYRARVEEDFMLRKTLAANRDSALFSAFSKGIDLQTSEAIMFLYAYMPLSDLADYDGEFFLANVQASIRSRNESKWGKEIPLDIFLHYVLPIRVNNENLDSFRIACFNEINERIRGLEAEAAALEINHWCHEKVSYQPADIRTSAPMSTILSARGRCGEESTFTVAALRTAGLPARQVYTPRWAHSDDNHAWVEVWIKGKWYYMGACEPEPVLDRGWFTEPARRAMLTNTKSFGAPSGNENTIAEYRNYSDVNTLSKYAATKRIFVKVTGIDGAPVKGATIEYQLYNYAEFYPLASVPTDYKGISSFETGFGDLLIWARSGNRFNFRKITVAETDTLALCLDLDPLQSAYSEYDLGVPVARSPLEGPPAESVRKNSERIAQENRIREEYIASWPAHGQATDFAEKTGTDTARVKDIIRRSMGNYRTIFSFIRNTEPGNRELAVTLLSQLADKDLRDIRYDALRDHLDNTISFEETGDKNALGYYKEYILNPRIAHEIIVPWRSKLMHSLTPEMREKVITDPSLLIEYVSGRLAINDTDNYYRTPVTPRGTEDLRVTDSFSRDIYFVALCRSLGIPSRLESGSRIPQYYYNKEWHDVDFSGVRATTGGKAFLRLLATSTGPVPEYYIHFTIARFADGRYNTLEYPENKRVTDFREELSLLPGSYMLVTGNRVNDCRILASVTFFRLEEGEHETLLVDVRKESAPAEILGKFDLKEEITMPDGQNRKIGDMAGNGVVIAWIDPDSEPAKHIFNDLPLLKKELDAWGGSFIFLTDPAGPSMYFMPGNVKGMPEKTFFCTDYDFRLLEKTCGALSCSNVRLPLLLLVDRDGLILFKSEGYRIGIGEQILKRVR